MRRISILAAAFSFCVAAPLRAQAPTSDLLALVPKDFGFCMIVHDLRGNWQRLEQAPWAKAFKKSPLAQSFLSAPEFGELAKFHRDLQKHLEVDWPSVRDDVLGDDFVFAYAAPDAAGKGEQGLLLLKARQPQLLKRLIDKLNEVQMKAGELKSLDELSHRDITYFRRVHAQSPSWWYALQGPVLALSSNEATLKSVLEKPADGAPIRAALRKAGAEKALASLWLNPRFFDNELKAKGKQAALLPEANVLNALLEHWKALDAVVVSLDVKEDVEVRLSLLARSDQLPPAVKEWFTRPGQASELWQRLPANSVFTLAGRTDFRALADGLLELAPEGMRKLVVDGASKTVGAALQLDLFRDVLPNMGPDWGICVLPASAGKEFPQALFALAVRPGDKKPGVDQSIYNALQFFGGLALFEYNRKGAAADAITLQTVQKGGVEIKYLAQDRLFPPGFQPALALKDGYLLLATSPAAVELFRKPEKIVDAVAAEVPMIRFAPAELAQLVRHHRERVVEQMALKSGQANAAAAQNLDGLLSLLDLCQTMTLSQRAGDQQLAWIVRLRMSN